MREDATTGVVPLSNGVFVLTLALCQQFISDC